MLTGIIAVAIVAPLLGVGPSSTNLIVDLDAFYRQDKNPDHWKAAFVSVR